MSDHPTTFKGDTAGTGAMAWDDRAALHRADDGDGVLDGANSLSRGTFAEMIRHMMHLPEEERAKYVIEKAGDREYDHGEVAALFDHPQFPAENTGD